MVARENAQMVAGLVAQAVVVVCVEPHEYGGATTKGDKRFRGKNAATFFHSFIFGSHTREKRMNELGIKMHESKQIFSNFNTMQMHDTLLSP